MLDAIQYTTRHYPTSPFLKKEAKWNQYKSMKIPDLLCRIHTYFIFTFLYFLLAGYSNAYICHSHGLFEKRVEFICYSKRVPSTLGWVSHSPLLPELPGGHGGQTTIRCRQKASNANQKHLRDGRASKVYPWSIHAPIIIKLYFTCTVHSSAQTSLPGSYNLHLQYKYTVSIFLPFSSHNNAYIYLHHNNAKLIRFQNSKWVQSFLQVLGSNDMATWQRSLSSKREDHGPQPLCLLMTSSLVGSGVLNPTIFLTTCHFFVLPTLPKKNKVSPRTQKTNQTHANRYLM